MLKLEKIKQFLKILLTVCIGIFIFLLSCYLCLFLFYYYHTTRNSNIYFNQITQVTQAIYPSFTLEQPILKYSYKGIGESNYIAIYRITTPQINTELVLKDQFVDCIKPTIKTKWMTPHLTFHYVQPPEYAKDHEDYDHNNYRTYLVIKHWNIWRHVESKKRHYNRKGRLHGATQSQER